MGGASQKQASVEEAEHKAASLLESIQVFQKISLLQIKKSVRMLLAMQQEALEAFVQKHSDYVIFLLNILDEKRSVELLQRLTDAALIYLSEEELRNLLIKEVGRLANSGKDFQGLSIFMDHIDRPEENALAKKKRISKEERMVIEMIPYYRKWLKKEHLKYLDRIGMRRRQSVSRKLIERNVDVALGLLWFCPDQIFVNILDGFAKQIPKLFQIFPEAVFLKRFEFGYSTYLSPKIKNNLPRSTQTLLDQLVEFSKHTEDYMLRLIEAFADPNLTPVQKRKIRLEELSKIIEKHHIRHIRIAFHDLQEIGVIEASDLELIETLVKENLWEV